MEKRWFRLASIDKKKLKDVEVLCWCRDIKYHYADDTDGPPAIWFFCDLPTKEALLSVVGVSIRNRI